MENSGKFPCSICKKGVGANSIQCNACGSWIHKKCCGIHGRLKSGVAYRCMMCVDGSYGQSEVLKEISFGTDSKLECVEKFCYLGDMIGAGGGAEGASGARVRCAWAKFKDLAPVLTSRGASLKVKGKVYRACVQRVLVYGSETWPIRVDNLQRLERTERMMVRWMCGVSLKSRMSSRELNERMGVVDVADVVRRERLRWFGHLERKDKNDWVSACRDEYVAGASLRGRGKKTWDECVKRDLISLGIKREMAKDRSVWRGLICGKPSNPCKHGKTDVVKR